MNQVSSRLWAEKENGLAAGRLSTKLWIAAGIAVAMGGAAWLFHYQSGDGTAAHLPAQELPQVVVSRPLERELDTRLGFLGQFSAVERVELRAQVGGTTPTQARRRR